MKRQGLLLLLIGSLLFLASMPATAQTTGRLGGRVTDSDGLAMPGVARPPLPRLASETPGPVRPGMACLGQARSSRPPGQNLSLAI